MTAEAIQLKGAVNGPAQRPLPVFLSTPMLLVMLTVNLTTRLVLSVVGQSREALRYVRFLAMYAAFVYGLAMLDVAGNMQMRIGAIIGGVITLVIGLVLAGVINSTAASAGGSGAIDSFAGAKSINDLVPLVYYTVIVMVAVGMIGLGVAGFAKRGPMS